MASRIETGHAKNGANFQNLIFITTAFIFIVPEFIFITSANTIIASTKVKLQITTTKNVG